MAVTRFHTRPLVVLAALTASLVGVHPLAQEKDFSSQVKVRESSPLAFPGMDAFQQISGLKKNSSSVPSGLRPSKPSRPTPEDSGSASTSGNVPNYNGNGGAGASSLPPLSPSLSPECKAASNQRHRWTNVSPFHDIFAAAGHQSLPDVRLAVDSMFRLSNRLQSLLRDPSGTNLLYSPIGLISTLGQIMLAARGQTLDELLSLLNPPPATPGCDPSDHFHASFRSLLAQVWSRRGSESYELSVRNALFHQHQPQAPLNRYFTSRLARDYATEIFPTDYKNSPIYAQQQINSWGVKASKGKIDQLMPSIPPRSTMAIISSVIYFKAIWENQFSKQFTIKSTFYLDGDHRGRTKELDFMSGEFELPYVESKTLGCKMVVLPYTNNETAMYLIMPLGSSKWKGPRPLPPLVLAQREGSKKDDDSLSTRSALPTDYLAPLPLNNAYNGQSGQRVYYNNNAGGRGQGAPYNIASQHAQGGWPNQYVPQPAPGGAVPNRYSYQQTSNPQRLRRRQTDSQQERARGHDAFTGESPFSATKLHELANRLGAEEFNSLIALTKPSLVSLFIPKLSMTTNVKLRDALAALGVSTVFGEGSNLSGAVNQTTGEEGSQGNPWTINEVWQQSRLEVTEEGTEAASGTAAVIIDYSLDSVVFKANSPFLAVIRHETTGAPIFWAAVANPS